MALVLLAALPAVVAFALESSAARAAVTQRLAAAGVGASWRALRCSLYRARCELEAARVDTPEATVAVGTLRLGWRWWPLLSGGLHLDTLSLEDVTVTVKAAPASAAPPAEPGPPRSALLRSLAEGPALRLEGLDVRRVTVHHASAGRELTLSDLALSGTVALGGGAAPRLALTLAGLRLAVRTPEREPSHARLEASLVATVDGDVLEVNAGVVARALEGPVPAPLGPWLTSRAQVTFAPDARELRLVVETLALLDGAGEGSLALRLPDDASLPRLGEGRLRLDVERLAPVLRLALPDLEARGVTLALESARARGDDELSVTAALDADHLAGLGVELQETRATLGATLSDTGFPRLAKLEAAARRATVAGLSIDELRLEASATPGLLATDGALTLAVKRLRHAEGPTPLEVLGVELQATVEGATPALSSGALRAKGKAAALRVETAGGEASLADARLDVDGALEDGRGRVRLTLPTGKLLVRGPGRAVSVASATLEGTFTELDPTRRTGRATLRLPLRALKAELSGASASVSSVVLTADVRGSASGPVRVDGTTGVELVGVTALREGRSVQLGRLGADLQLDLLGDTLRRLVGTISTAGVRAVAAPGAPPLAFADGRLEVDAVGLGAANGRLRVKGALPPLEVDLAAEVTERRLVGTLRARAATLAPFAPLVPPLGEGMVLDLAPAAAELDAKVRVDDVREPWRVLADEARATVTGLAGKLRGQQVTAERASLALTHAHAGADDTLRLALELLRPRVDDVTLDGGLVATVDAELHRARGEGRLTLALRALGEERAATTLHFRRERDGRVHHELTAGLKPLGPLVPLVRALALVPPEVDLSRLGLTLSSSGDTLGFLDAQLEPVDDWQALSDTTLVARLGVTDLVHHTEGEEVQVPRLDFAVDAGVLHGAVTFRSSVEAPRIDVDLGPQHLTLVGLHQVLTGRSDSRPDAGLLHLALDGVIDDVEQNLFPPWRPAAVHVAGAARVDRLAALSVDRLLVESERGGTRLELTKRLRRDAQPTAPGAPDGGLWSAGGQRFLLEGRLAQDLARLDGAPKRFVGRGRLAMPLTVDSADHTLFRVRGRLELTDVHLRLPADGLVVEGASGTVPLEEAITFDPQVGLTLVPSSERHVFARARYQDVQPFLSGDSLVTVKRIQLGDFAFGPVVASLEVERNRFSLNKLKAERGPARLSGQLFVDYLPGAETVTFRGAITGLPRQGADTPLDANAALVFSPSRLELDGRVQVVRTSREHLLDLLNVLDPHREVASLNRLRSAMRFGYPKSAQLSFGAGLLSMDVAFGGLAGLFDLGTVRGVSLGPFFSRYLAPRDGRRTPP